MAEVLDLSLFLGKKSDMLTAASSSSDSSFLNIISWIGYLQISVFIWPDHGVLEKGIWSYNIAMCIPLKTLNIL